MMPLMLTTIAGGLADSILRINTPAQTFLRLLPWLMLAATGLIAFEKVFTRRISAGISHNARIAAIAGAAVLELIVALCGGYFGGGIRIMTLAMSTAFGITDIHAMNALKSVLSGGVNGVARSLSSAMYAGYRTVN
jgi:uncharacterized protein